MKKWVKGFVFFILLILGLTVSVIVSSGILLLLNDFKSISAGAFSIVISYLFLQYVQKYWLSVNRQSEYPDRDLLSLRLFSILLGSLLFFLISVSNPTMLSYIILSLVSTAVCYKLFQYTEIKWPSLEHRFFVRFSSWAFGLLVFIFTAIAALFALLLHRSPEYANGEIINYILPYFKVIALLIGPFLVTLRRHLRSKNK